jgi:hypothetical protein
MLSARSMFTMATLACLLGIASMSVLPGSSSQLRVRTVSDNEAARLYGSQCTYDSSTIGMWWCAGCATTWKFYDDNCNESVTQTKPCATGCTSGYPTQTANCVGG